MINDFGFTALRRHNRRLVPVIAGPEQPLCCVIMSCTLLCLGEGMSSVFYLCMDGCC